jgi:rare lipoprotein A
MLSMNRRSSCALVLLSGAIAAGIAGYASRHGSQGSTASQDADAPAGVAKAQPDLTGRPRVGVASVYAGAFSGREMANGAPMNPATNNAASRTLPLGTIAEVTNLSTGQSAVVTIEDRGPYAKGRLVDLSPSTARKIGVSRKKGIARVRVSPISMPLADGKVKAGTAVDEAEATKLR